MSRHDLDAELVRKLAGLLDETGLTELEYATQAVRIRVARQAQTTGFALPAAPLAASPAPVAAQVAAPVADADHPGTITSPMVGTAYIAPEPGAPAFIRVGDTVRQGQTLLIIEAMKVMNPLTAPKSGRVVNILVGDGQPVEFGEPLLILE